MSLLGTFKTLHSKPSTKPARFVLKYEPPTDTPVTVGFLTFEDGQWTFFYDEEFKRRTDLRPIEGLDDRTKVYRSTVLFPFFMVRIPDVDRDDIKERLRQDRVRRPELADLLRIFGRRSVSSPSFELLPA